MVGEVFDCPQCEGRGYDLHGQRCELCDSLGKVEDGGPSVAVGYTQPTACKFYGKSGFKSVINLRRDHDK